AYLAGVFFGASAARLAGDYRAISESDEKEYGENNNNRAIAAYAEFYENIGQLNAQLHLVCLTNDVERARSFISVMGVDVNIIVDVAKQETLLMRLCKNDCVKNEMVQVLLDAGADVHAVDIDRKTALHYVVG